MIPHLILEENHDFPLCRIQITFRQGASSDQPENGFPIGLANFATELMRRGAAGKSRAVLDEQLDQLGASLTVSCGYDSVVFDLLVLKENLPNACIIFAEVLFQPEFSIDEAQRLQRELLADLDEIRDDDQSLVSRFFSRALYSPHPYGNPISGTEQSIPLLNEKLASLWYQNQQKANNVIFGVAGDLTKDEASQLLLTYFSPLLQSQVEKQTPHQVPIASRPQAKVILVDKPERTQSQILLGQLAPKWADPSWLPLQIATTAFGGTFTSKLMEEVRSKRGLSYGASASLGGGKDPQGLILHVFPSAQQTKETLELILSLYQNWASSLQTKDILFAKDYLMKSHAFSIQTPESRLKRRTQLELCGLPQEYAFSFPERVSQVSEQQVVDALEKTLRPNELVLTLVATAETMLPELKKIEALDHIPIEVVPYDQDEFHGKVT